MDPDNLNTVAPEAGADTGAAPLPIPEPVVDSIADDIRAAMKPAEGVEQPRGEDGKFKTKGGEQPPAEENSGQGTDEENGGGEEQAGAPIAAPASWSDSEKAEFEKLPPEMRQIVLSRESEREQGVQKKFQEVGEKARFSDEVIGILGTKVQELAAQNVTPSAYIQQLSNLSDYANKNPVGFIRDMAAHYKLDLFQVAASLVNDPSNPMFNDPEVVQMRTRLQMNDEAWQHHVTNRKVANDQTDQQRRHSVVVSWSQQKDAGGNLMRPHFDAVANEMIPLIASVRKTNPQMEESKVLDTAYEMAIHANPTTRAKVLDDTRRKAEEDKVKEQREKAAKAKAAAVGVSGTSPSSRTHQPTSRGSIEDDVRAAIRSLS